MSFRQLSDVDVATSITPFIPHSSEHHSLLTLSPVNRNTVWMHYTGITIIRISMRDRPRRDQPWNVSNTVSGVQRTWKSLRLKVWNDHPPHLSLNWRTWHSPGASYPNTVRTGWRCGNKPYWSSPLSVLFLTCLRSDFSGGFHKEAEIQIS